MSDRWVFLTAFLSVVLIVAGAFVIPQYFIFELARSSVFVAVAVMVFFGDNKFSFMLGTVAPVLGFILNILLGGFFQEFVTLWEFITLKPLSSADTPLHGLAILIEALLVALCFRAWRKQVPEKFFGKTFGICLAVSIVYIGIVTGVYFKAVPPGAQMP